MPKTAKHKRSTSVSTRKKARVAALLQVACASNASFARAESKRFESEDMNLYLKFMVAKVVAHDLEAQLMASSAYVSNFL